MAEKLRSLGVAEGDRIWLPFPYDDKRARMRAPWVNALGQAVALALFSRLHRLEGKPEDLAFATGLFNSLTQLKRADGPWVSEIDPDGYLWFEHYPDGLRGHVLNAHAYAVLALRDYWQEVRIAGGAPLAGGRPDHAARQGAAVPPAGDVELVQPAQPRGPRELPPVPHPASCGR